MSRIVNLDDLLLSINAVFDSRTARRVTEYLKDYPKATEVEERGRWIPVTERLPESEIEVLIKSEKGTITTALYEDGTVEDDNSCWNWSDIDFIYDETRDVHLIPEGWWEYRHYNPDDVYNNLVDEKVTAWRPLPESYNPMAEELQKILDKECDRIFK